MKPAVFGSNTVEKPARPPPLPGSPSFDGAGFDAIYQEHAQAIYYLALRCLGSTAQAEDVTQDVFLKAYRKMHQFRGDSSIRTWLYRIAINHCRNLSQTWHQRHVVCPGDETMLEQAAPQRSPLRILEVKELGERVQQTLEELPEEYRVLLLLAADEHLSYDEIAALTEQSRDAVRGKLHRARKAFVQHFQKKGL
jgi:RNA polymerase sigma-70 factor, ECF subfamily